MIDFALKLGLAYCMGRLSKSMAASVELRSPGDPACCCPNCGKQSSFVGMCHECFAGFEATEGGWPAWEEAKQRWAAMTRATDAE